MTFGQWKGLLWLMAAAQRKPADPPERNGNGPERASAGPDDALEVVDVQQRHRGHPQVFWAAMADILCRLGAASCWCGRRLRRALGWSTDDRIVGPASEPNHSHRRG